LRNSSWDAVQAAARNGLQHALCGNTMTEYTCNWGAIEAEPFVQFTCDGRYSRVLLTISARFAPASGWVDLPSVGVWLGRGLGGPPVLPDCITVSKSAGWWGMRKPDTVREAYMMEVAPYLEASYRFTFEDVSVSKDECLWLQWRTALGWTGIFNAWLRLEQYGSHNRAMHALNGNIDALCDVAWAKFTELVQMAPAQWPFAVAER